MPKAISYVRFSSAAQGSGSTVERQQEMIAQWLHEHPTYELSNLSATDPAKSGYKGEHLDANLGGILQAIEKGIIKEGDALIVEAMDRLGRMESLDMLTLVTNILKKGVSIVTIEDNQEYSRKTTTENGSALYVLLGKIQQSHEYSERLSRRLLSAYESKRRKARSGEKIRRATPIWLSSEGEIIEDKAECIRECVDLYLKGYGTRRIILELLEKYPFLNGTHPSTLKRWFNNRSLMGDWETLGESITDVYPSLISREKFFKLQKVMQDRSKKMSKEESYGLSGLVFCGECNSRFYFRRKAFKKHTIIYANCSTYLKRGSHFCNNNNSWPYKALESLYDNSHEQFLSSAVFDLAHQETEGRIEALITEKKDLESKIGKYVDALAIIPNQEQIINKIKTLDSEVREIDNKIYLAEAEARGDESPDQDELNAINDMVRADPTYIRQLLQKLNYRIIIKGKTATVESGPANLIQLELLKRSTRYNCYLLKYTLPEYSIESANEDGKFYEYEEEITYQAVDNNGFIINCGDLNGLEEFLERRKSSY